MRILLFSDTHGHVFNMITAVSRIEKVDLVIHLGDFVRDALKLKDSYSHLNFEIVRGNNDWTEKYPLDKLIYAEGKKILITHGHYYNVKSGYDRLILKGKQEKADAIFFGHTHIPEEIYIEGMLILNPGSASVYSKSDKSTYCIIELKDGIIRPKFRGI